MENTVIRSVSKMLVIVSIMIAASGCVPVVIGAAAAGGYAVGSDSDNGSLGTYISDSAITANVKSKFLTERNLLSNSLHVTTKKGVVELSGHVPTTTMRDIAVQLAGDVRGVKKIINAIEVRS